MTIGPFDTPLFLGDTEFGGGPGLVQSHEDHEVTPSEQLGINRRADMVTGIDPVTGRLAV